LLKNSLRAARSSSKAKLDTRPQVQINPILLDEVFQNPRAVAAPVTQPDLTLHAYLDLAKRVQNTLPFNATWDGNMEGQLTAATVIEMVDKDEIRTR